MTDDLVTRLAPADHHMSGIEAKLAVIILALGVIIGLLAVIAWRLQ